MFCVAKSGSKRYWGTGITEAENRPCFKDIGHYSSGEVIGDLGKRVQKKTQN